MSSAPQEVREARLALGRKLAGLRKAAGYTQNSLAPLTLYGRSTVANVELGRQSVGRDFWVRCDQILDTGGALAADYDRMQARARQLDRLSALRGLPWPSGPDHADGEDVDGRSPLRGRRPDASRPEGGLLAAAHTLGPAGLALDDLDRFHAVGRDAPRYLDADLVRYLDNGLDRCATDDGVHGPRHALPGVLGIVALVQHCARDAKPQVRQPLLALGARAAEFAGWLYRDCGQPSPADYWRDRAAEWAMEAADFAMPGYVLIKKSQSAWDDRDAPRMLGLARAAREGPWRLPARVMAEAVQQQARGLAMLGTGQRQVDDMLKEARDFLDLAAEDRTSLAAHYDTVLFKVQTAICYGESGRPEQAVEIYGSTLTPTVFSARDLAYFSTLKAQTLVAVHRLDDAALAATAAIGAAAAAGSARTLRELFRLRRRLQPWRARPAVHGFLRLMDAV
ncbi:hypothetical protein GCM10009541_59470 [Micromonospora gifhornensis]|uniref:Helix-turn-helix domain-containing protein n=1 Tax=Micromonospora gifhornensis TaxID=84594 RepID=A0ABQ4IMX1_9ACTN|nr:helix-turn-helix transcriptional regulator [Micromonospora gifhornensis]GIJ19053.1 hypothetical protein Vgi01_57370 [Micromonospora gifhornensis]